MNWIGIILATVAALVIGSLWYGTWAFGKSWMALAGHRMGEGQQPGPLYALTAVAALLEAITLSWFIGQTGWRTSSGGALIGLFAALGFTATAMFSEVLFAGRPARLYAINAGYTRCSRPW